MCTCLMRSRDSVQVSDVGSREPSKNAIRLSSLKLPLSAALSLSLISLSLSLSLSVQGGGFFFLSVL